MKEEDYQAVRKVLVDTLQQLNDTRNETIEEVAKEIEKMGVFGKDTISSFTTYIRGMKK
jgi:hypothetical protein